MSDEYISDLQQKQPHVIRHILDSVVQNADETIERFADRVLQMTQLGYPSVAEEEQHFIAIDHFVMGLRPPCNIFESSKYPSNFDEAVGIVIREGSKNKFETSKNETHSITTSTDIIKISGIKITSCEEKERPTKVDVNLVSVTWSEIKEAEETSNHKDHLNS